MEHQALRWIRPVDAVALPLAALDRELLRWIAAPRLLAITPEDGCLKAAHPERDRRGFGPAGAAIPAAQCWQLLRWPSLSDARYRDALQRWLAARPHNDRPVLVHNRIDLAGMDALAGVHLSAATARSHRERPLPRSKWLSVACHDAREVEQAHRIDADLLLLAPVRQTATHPDAEALGWAAFSALVRGTERPVLALGGMAPADLQLALAAGAQGVAGIRAFA
jgi:8-oxo-dGTP diphosphatase